MNEILLIVMCGLPRSGKTTWARKQGFPIVSPDQIRYAMHGQRYETLAEPMVWAVARIMVRALFLAGHSNVIVDGCHNSRERRDEWSCTNAEDDLGCIWNTIIKYIDTDELTCIIRAEKIDDDVITDVIRSMAVKFEPPAGNERKCS